MVLMFVLKKVDLSHRELMLKWRNKDSIREVMYNDAPISRENHIKWFDQMQQNPQDKYLIFLFNDCPIGLINFINFHNDNKTCEWGFYIGNDEAPKGAGSIMAYLALDYIFSQEKMRKVKGEVLASNHKSVAFHKYLGFSQEGLFRKEVLRNDIYTDILRFGLLKEEWNIEKVRIKEKLYSQKIEYEHYRNR
jgi:UDP-4-amino-4,6-dideoxy-N-acetyl-beta-L-altrosamine N-acetyltransferase